MTKKCCIRECKGNYNKENQRKVFRLPNSETERKLWLSSIPRSTLTLSKDAVICEDHWPKNTTMVSHRGKRRPIDPPGIFKVSASSEKFAVSSKTKKLLPSVRNNLQDELPAFEENDRFNSFNDLAKRIVTFAYPNCELAKVVLDSRVKIVAIECVEGKGIPLFSLDVNEDFTYEAYHCGSRCWLKNLEALSIKKINRQSLIEEAIRFLKNLEINRKQKTILNPISLLAPIAIGNRKYNNETIVQAFEYFVTSRSGYSKFWRDFELPSVYTLTRLTSKVKKLEDSQFFHSIFSNLSEDREKIGALLIDEVCVKSALEYQGGQVFGSAANKPEKLANTLLCFMVACTFGGPNFICKMIHVKELNSESLYEQTTALLEELKQSGAEVAAIKLIN